MHQIEQTPKIITIIGLVVEGIAALIIGALAIFFSYFDKMSIYPEIIAEMTPEELESFEIITQYTTTLMIITASVFIVMFIINLFLFSKLIKGSFTEAQARKVYLYQAIWGGINIFANAATGILYLISGIQGYNGLPDRIDTREGI